MPTRYAVVKNNQIVDSFYYSGGNTPCCVANTMLYDSAIASGYPDNTPQPPPPPPVTEFTSTQQNVATSSIVSVAHGLSGAPTKMGCSIIFTQTDSGVPAGYKAAQSLKMYASPTVLYAVIPDTLNVINYNGQDVSLNNAKQKLILWGRL